MPKWLDDLRHQHNVQKPFIQSLMIDRSNVPTSAVKSIDVEEDGSLLSAFGLVKQYIEQELNEANMSRETKPYVRSFLRKSGIKLPRYCGCYQLFHQSLLWCEEIIDKVNFIAGSHVGNQAMDLEFVDAAQRLVKLKMKELPKNSNGRPIMQISKAIVIAANKHYQYTKESSIQLFTTEDIDQIIAERLVKFTSVKDVVREIRQKK
jgi:hypothetical protein